MPVLSMLAMYVLRKSLDRAWGALWVFFFFSFVFILGRVCYIAQTGHCFKVILQSQPTEYNSTLLFGGFFGGVGPYVSLVDLALVL